MQWLELAVPIGTETLTKVRALDVPAGREPDVEAMHDALEEWRDFSQEAVNAAYAGNTAQYQSVFKAAFDANTEYVESASDLGAVDCVANPYQ